MRQGPRTADRAGVPLGGQEAVRVGTQSHLGGLELTLCPSSAGRSRLPSTGGSSAGKVEMSQPLIRTSFTAASGTRDSSKHTWEAGLGGPESGRLLGELSLEPEDSEETGRPEGIL